MGGKTDIVKGRIKEAAGALTGNDSLCREGQADQVVGKVKQAVKKAVAGVQNAAEMAVDKAKKVTRQKDRS